MAPGCTIAQGAIRAPRRREFGQVGPPRRAPGRHTSGGVRRPAPTVTPGVTPVSVWADGLAADLLILLNNKPLTGLAWVSRPPFGRCWGKPNIETEPKWSE
jgi:hypothetical protein